MNPNKRFINMMSIELISVGKKVKLPATVKLELILKKIRNQNTLMSLR